MAVRVTNVGGVGSGVVVPAFVRAEALHAGAFLDHRKVRKGVKLAQKLGQFQPSIAVFPQECMRQVVYFGPI